MAPVAPRPYLPLAFRAKCQCGKVGISVHALEQSPPLRLVCYCKDCRGYYESLNRISDSASSTALDDPHAHLDNWGGVDWTSVYPRDVTILKGQELLATTKIREASGIRQVYSTCCYTPLFRVGGMSMLMNSNTMIPEDKGQAETGSDGNGLPVTFRIIGREAWTNGKNEDMSKPPMSWSVPFKWFWTMPRRIKKDLMEPMPFDLPDAGDCKALEGFKEGSADCRLSSFWWESLNQLPTGGKKAGDK